MASSLRVVAARLRAIRQAQGLSINELSKRASVAKATLAQLELGRGNPTLETLMALATHLDVSLTDLLIESDRPLVTVTRSHEGAEVRSDGLRLRCMHRSSNGASLIEVFDMHMRHGTFESQAHAPGVHEDLILHSGEVCVGPVGAMEVLNRGDFISFEGDRPHRYECKSDTAHATLLVRYPTRSAARFSTVSPPA
ncbi:helix-turn-helix domain-containing protein [Pseudonocardia sp. RS010]|uniref:helix-turn-helix domain-containing protein n=1 Tax=Pseudonocardia sp. RS010 TaxID=3385979 RepID=UPI0039A1710A